MARDVGVGGDLPAGEVDGLEAALHHLHGLVACECAQGVDVVALVEQSPELVGAALSEGVADSDAARELLDVFCAEVAQDAVEAAGDREAVCGCVGGILGGHGGAVWPERAPRAVFECGDSLLEAVQAKLPRLRAGGREPGESSLEP